MPGFLLHANAAITCQHVSGQATLAPGQTRVLVNAQPVAVIPPGLPTIAVAGCPFTVGTKPQPCVTVRWMQPSTRVKVMGLPVMLAPGPGTGPGVCQSAEQIPQGAPVLGAMQARVSAL